MAMEEHFGQRFTGIMPHQVLAGGLRAGRMAWIGMLARIRIVAALVWVVFSSGYLRASEPTSGLHAVVTIAPLKGLVEPLLPAGSKVTVLMPPGRSEHGYEFSPSDVAALAGADIVVYVGLNLEPRIARSLRERPVAGQGVICFAEVVGLQRRGEPEPNSDGGQGGNAEPAKGDESSKQAKPSHAGEAAPKKSDTTHVDHVHDATCDHAHDEGWIDQHIWLDPMLVRLLVPAVSKAVQSAITGRGVAPEIEESHLASVQDAEKALVTKIEGVDRAWRDGLAPFKGASIVTHHAAFGRPALRYGIEIANVIRKGEGQEPTPGDIADVVKSIREQKVRAIFVEPQFNARSAERIAKAANVRLGRLDPLGDGDWFEMMRGNLEQLTTNLGSR